MNNNYFNVYDYYFDVLLSKMNVLYELTCICFYYSMNDYLQNVIHVYLLFYYYSRDCSYDYDGYYYSHSIEYLCLFFITCSYFEDFFHFC